MANKKNPLTGMYNKVAEAALSVKKKIEYAKYIRETNKLKKQYTEALENHKNNPLGKRDPNMQIDPVAVAEMFVKRQTMIRKAAKDGLISHEKKTEKIERMQDSINEFLKYIDSHRKLNKFEELKYELLRHHLNLTGDVKYDKKYHSLFSSRFFSTSATGDLDDVNFGNDAISRYLDDREKVSEREKELILQEILKDPETKNNRHAIDLLLRKGKNEEVVNAIFKDVGTSVSTGKLDGDGNFVYKIKGLNPVNRELFCRAVLMFLTSSEDKTKNAHHYISKEGVFDYRDTPEKALLERAIKGANIGEWLNEKINSKDFSAEDKKKAEKLLDAVHSHMEYITRPRIT